MGAGDKVLTYIDEQAVSPQKSESWASSQVSFLWATQRFCTGGKTREGESELVISRTIQCSVTESGKAQKP